VAILAAAVLFILPIQATAANANTGTDTSLSVFTVNGVAVVDKQTVPVLAGVFEVDVVATPTDPTATRTIDGNVGLVPGNNPLVVEVTAGDGITKQTYEINLDVANSPNDTGATITIDGTEFVEGTIELPALTTSVQVGVVTRDESATFEVTGGTDLNPGLNVITVEVTAFDGTIGTYTINVNVALNTDTSLSTFTVNGIDVIDGEVVELPSGTESVEVEAIASDADADFVVTGATDLVTGQNELKVTVTAADGVTVEEITVILDVLVNNDTSLAVFEVNGEAVEDQSEVTLEPLVNEVEVVVETTDIDATYEITGDTNLEPGLNILTVTVTAADGTTADYNVTLNVAFNTDTSLLSVLVNGVDTAVGEVVELAPYTESVDVDVQTSDPEANIEISGDADLAPGDNLLLITVTAADGETVEEFEITLNVLFNNDTSLSSFKVNGADVEDGSVIDLPAFTSSVDVVALTTDSDATVVIDGDTELAAGENTLTVTVTAADDSTLEYFVTLNVAFNDDATVKQITINDVVVTSGAVINLEYLTETVDVAVETTDADATVSISGDTDLVSGENELVVTVIAADETTSIDYIFTLVVALSNETALSVFQVNGADVEDGAVIELEAGTTSVEVIAETLDADATFVVSGDQDLVTGNNDLIVTVTAADEQSFYEYLVTLVVAPGTNTDLATLTVNGTEVFYGDEVELEAGTTDVEVEVETQDPDATFSVEGDSGLLPGDNFLVVTVLAADGETSSEYVVILKVLSGIDTSIASLLIDGNEASPDDVVDLAEDTTEVEVQVETTDPDATFEVFGDSELVVGENELTITVLAADGETFEDFIVILVVPASTNTELAVFKINGTDVADGDTFETEPGVTSVELTIEPQRIESTFEVAGGADLVVGENELTVTVTAPDGETTAEYKVIILVPSSDSSVIGIFVDGLLTAAGDIVTVDKEATSVDVSVETTNEFATSVVRGADELVVGDNTVTVIVTAQDGTTTEYVFTVRVGGASADTALETLTLNGAEVVDGQTVQLPSRTTSVNVVAITRDPSASAKITGRTGLVVGSNDVVVTVTAADLKTVRVITIKAVVAPLSSNTDLSTFTVNGLAAVDQGTLALPPLTRVVNVVATPADAESVVVITGRSNLVDGANTLTVNVTAANGTVKTYTVTLNVRVLSTDVTLSAFTVNGIAPVDGVVTLAPGTTTATVVATPNSPTSLVVVSGATGLRTGDNALAVLVTAESGATRTYRVTMKVPASNNTDLGILTINAVTTATGSTVNLPRGTTGVAVRVATADPLAQFVVTGATGLVAGSNTLSVKVTAANGTTEFTHTVTLFVALPSADAAVKNIKINGTTVEEQGTITVPALTASVVVDVQTNDPEAKAVVTGRTGLVGGDNTVSIAVTAANGTTVKNYSVTVRVLVLSSDVTLKSFTVNTQAFVDGLTLSVPFGTRSVDVAAETNDAGARFAVIGNGGLKTGSNNVTLKVTAANGTSKDYVVVVNVLKSTSTALNALFVNGQDALSGATITVPARTNLAQVKAATADAEATVAISGTTLTTGSNTVVVVVTAADGTTKRTVNVTVVVTALSSDSTLKSLTANGVAYTSRVELPIGSKAMPVVAVANDSGASVEITGNTNLAAGLNNIRVRVTAANGTFTDTTVEAFVLSRSTNTGISTVAGTWLINGVDVAVEGTVVDLAAGRTAVAASAKPADAKATIAVTGTSGLVAGLNTVTFTVTAEDGTSTASYTRSVRVLVLSSDVTLKSFTVNTQAFVDGLTLSVPFGTRSVDVAAETNDAGARFAVIGNGGLKTGSNNVTLKVTAANGTSKDYVVVVNVLKSTSTALNALFVNGQDALSGATITVPARTNLAQVKAATADAEATVAISGTTLTTGSNTVVVVVTAADGTTKRTVNVTVVVTALSSDSTLKSLTANGVAYTSRVELPIGSKAMPVVAVANDSGASVEITGNTNLAAGLNNIRVRVTAANGTFTDTTVEAFVLSRSTNTGISTVAGTWLINGVDVAVEGTVVDLAAGRTAVAASAKPADAKATIAVTGTSGLVAGLNTVTFTVTAEDGTSTASYTRSVRVAALSSNSSLTSLTVADSVVVSGDTVNVPFGTTRVSVIPVVASSEAKFTVSGNTGLNTGSNSVVVTVTAPSGAQTVNTVTVLVAAAAANTGLSTFTINDQAVTDGATLSVAAGTTRVRVSAIADDAAASVEIVGKSGLGAGNNTLTVTVTALSGASTTYTVTVNVGN
jgi:hypothetical protein